jgi:hypothetical protein|tara:strand:- start:307 stop:663 length:357 start_codon:yes stop_codon:yes gene_type:complete
VPFYFTHLLKPKKPRKSSEANRQLVAELGGVVPMVSCALFARDGGPVRNAAQALANVAFGSHFAVAKCLMARADAALCAAISATDLLSENSLLEAASADSVWYRAYYLIPASKLGTGL